ncbi:MAG TPA: ABC transporter permease [Chitinophagales bacterium]|jgi:peptide/nickel transport system permease protein|nr:ABC transporter permease [Chitinophagales bacterium]
MLKYIIKRIAIFIPTLFVISLVTFYLSVNVPGDPVEQMLNSNSEMGSAANAQASEKAYIEKRKQLGLDLPIFYFSLSNAAMPKNLYEIPKKFQRQNLERLIDKYGNWTEISTYYQSLRKLELTLADTKKDSTNADALINIKDKLQDLYLNYKDNVIEADFASIAQNLKSSTTLNAVNSDFQTVKNNYEKGVKEKATPYKKYIPAFRWYGTQSQYHQWITKFMVGDFGISYQDQRPVKKVIWEAVRWTVLLSIISIFLTYIIAIPLGIQSAANKDSTGDKTISTLLFMLYSLPVFWVATLLIMFLGGGDFLGWFPAYGVGDISDSDSFMSVAWTRFYHLVLPMVCYTYGGLAFLYRQMRGAMINTLSQDYIRTARAKGLDEKTVLWKHAFKNSLLPIITLFANVFPLVISGAIIIESKFSIPGMGKTAIEAISARNYPMIYTIVMFSAILTMIGYLVADILYAVVDPRISYNKK